MKKILLVLVLMLSVSVLANAQFKFGFKAAANFATTNGEGDEMKVGFSGGILGQIKFNDRWALQPEVLYSMQGPQWDGGKLMANYVAVPIMVQFYVIEGLSIEMGPQVGILTSAKVKYDKGGSLDMKDSLEPIEAALNIGVAYELSTAPLGFFFRSSIGMTRVGKENTLLDEDLRNLSFQLGAFVKF